MENSPTYWHPKEVVALKQCETYVLHQMCNLEGSPEDKVKQIMGMLLERGRQRIQSTRFVSQQRLLAEDSVGPLAWKSYNPPGLHPRRDGRVKTTWSKSKVCYQKSVSSLYTPLVCIPKEVIA